MCTSFKKTWTWQLQAACIRLYMSYECSDKSENWEVCMESQSIALTVILSKTTQKKSSWRHHW
jgi:hypothetical protein